MTGQNYFNWTFPRPGASLRGSMVESEPAASAMDPAAKRQTETLLELPPPEKKPKPSVLHVIVKLLDDLKQDEVPQLQALLSARMNLDYHIFHKSWERERQGRNSANDVQTSKESPCGQFGNATSEVLLMGRNKDKVASLAHVSSKTNEGGVREEIVALKNNHIGNNSAGLFRSDAAGENCRPVHDGIRYPSPNISKKPVRNDEAMVASGNPPTVFPNTHKSDHFSQFISQALQNDTSAKAKMNNPDYVAFQHAQCQFRKLQTTESVKKIWDVQNTSFVGTYLLVDTKLHLALLSSRLKSRWIFTKEHDLLVPEQEQIMSLRQKVVSQCTKLAKRCGGLSALEARCDDCSKFFVLSSSFFNFTSGEIEEMKKPALCFSHVPNFVAVPQHVQNIPKSQTLWEHPDPTLIGRSLVTQATYELEEQYTRNKLLRDAGKVPNSFFGREFELFDEGQVRALRKRVLENCGKLAKLCGGISRLRERGDECLDYTRMATTTYDLSHEELYNASVSDLKGKGKAEDQNCSAIKAAKLEVSTAKARLSFAKSSAKVGKIWDNSDIAQVGSILFAHAEVQSAVQNLRRIHAENNGIIVPNDCLIGRDKFPMKVTEFQDHRGQALSHCRKLAIRCGGLSKLRARSDDCAKFLEHCIATFKFEEDELEANEKDKTQQMSTTSAERYKNREVSGRFISTQDIAASVNGQYHEENARKPHIAEGNSAAECSGIWGKSDVSEIGSRLLEQAQLESAEQDYRRNKLIMQGAEREQVKDALISFDLAILAKEEAQAHRETVLEQCAKLSKRCGGFTKLLLRADDCPKFIQLSMDTYNITPDESGTWM